MLPVQIKTFEQLIYYNIQLYMNIEHITNDNMYLELLENNIICDCMLDLKSDNQCKLNSYRRVKCDPNKCKMINYRFKLNKKNKSRNNNKHNSKKRQPDKHNFDKHNPDKHKTDRRSNGKTGIARSLKNIDIDNVDENKDKNGLIGENFMMPSFSGQMDQNMNVSNKDKYSFCLISNNVILSKNIYADVAFFPWDTDKYQHIKNIRITFCIDATNDETCVIQLSTIHNVILSTYETKNQGIQSGYITHELNSDINISALVIKVKCYSNDINNDNVDGINVNDDATNNKAFEFNRNINYSSIYGVTLLLS